MHFPSVSGIDEEAAPCMLQFCNLIFGGWDFCIENSKAAAVKHRAIYNEFCTHIEAEKYREEEEQRTRKER